MKSKLSTNIGLVAAIAAAIISSSAAAEKDDILIRELVAAQSLAFDPGGPTSVLESKVDGLLRELEPTAYKTAALALIKPLQQHYRHDTYSLVMKWGIADPKEAFDFLSTHSPALLSGNVLDELLKEWAYRDSEQALAAARKVIPEGNRPDAASTVLRIMATTSPSRAMSEIDRNDSRFSNLVSDILVYWVSLNPTEATRWTLAQDRHHQLVWDAAYSWSSFDRQAATAWANTLTHEDRTMALTGILTQQAATTFSQTGNQEKSAKDFMALFPNPTLDQEGYANQAVTHLAQYIVRSWSSLDNTQRDVMNWIMRLPDVRNREFMAYEVFAGWVLKNYDQAEIYGESLPEGRLKDNARLILVTNLSTKDPQKGFEKALRIIDEGLWTRAMGHLFFWWQRNAPNEASAAMTKLSEQQKSKIMDEVSKLKERSKRPPREN